MHPPKLLKTLNHYNFSHTTPPLSYAELETVWGGGTPGKLPVEQFINLSQITSFVPLRYTPIVRQLPIFSFWDITILHIFPKNLSESVIHNVIPKVTQRNTKGNTPFKKSVIQIVIPKVIPSVLRFLKKASDNVSDTESYLKKTANRIYTEYATLNMSVMMSTHIGTYTIIHKSYLFKSNFCTVFIQ